ncbi:serine/threonine-protein kinase [Streptacidiphilus fuscans]|uniref:non-specific serine/threonine protein kinase n=1 Tax=Streptacidiphilus fuscans TaxID=2789292 RepID=A0A931AXG4_9ACTN|nr:serine/threonine-protein kinase [Streptacidiphilus fuscans]MBF9067184.1 serine/threonine protein kinase [Streptacidiphilus fuscans]
MSEEGNDVGVVGDTGAGRPGRLVGGRYRLQRRLGSGGFGSVWLAHDEVLGVDVAVKEVQLPSAASPEEHSERVLRAQREARHAARLRDHPNVAGVHDVVVDSGVPWTVMQLIVGRSLEDRIAAEGPLPAADVARVAQAVLAALGAAHAAGIVHRDVKPANILLADDGQVLLADFGIAVQQDQTALTASGVFIGSVDYLAPERAHGSPAAPAGDLFSLGATLYQAVEGRLPFRRDTPVATLTAVLFEDAPPTALAGPLAPLINGLLEKDPAARLTGPQAESLLARTPLPYPPTAPATRPLAGSADGPVAGSVPRPGADGPVVHAAFPPPRRTPPSAPPTPAPGPQPRFRRAVPVLAPVGVLALIGIAMPLTAAGLSLTLPHATPQSLTNMQRALDRNSLPVHRALGLDGFPSLASNGALLPWLLLLPALTALVCAAVLPYRPHIVLRIVGYACALVLPVCLVVTDLQLRPDHFALVRALPASLAAELSVTFGPGWWLLHAATALTLATLVWTHIRSAAATRTTVAEGRREEQN